MTKVPIFTADIRIEIYQGKKLLKSHKIENKVVKGFSRASIANNSKIKKKFEKQFKVTNKQTLVIKGIHFRKQHGYGINDL